jgi:DNA processing protein
MKAARPLPPFFIDMNDNDRRCLLGLASLRFLSAHEKVLLVDLLGSPSLLFEQPLLELSRLTGRRMHSKAWRPQEILRAAESAEKSLTDAGARGIFYWESAYPPQLREIYDPPPVIFVRGTLPEHTEPLAGIVGTRYPTGAAREAAFSLGFGLGRAGVVVVSGLARGVDRAAHEGCVEAGGRSIAVLGNGIDAVYPVSSRTAAIALLDRGGCLVSEYLPGVPPARFHFPARNRIISGLCRSVVVVQAPAKSGALITAEYALEQGRDLWVHAAGLCGSAGAGTRGLREAGAPCLAGANALLEDWGRWRKPFAQRAHGLPTGELLAARLRHEINGAAVSRAGEVYWRA